MRRIGGLLVGAATLAWASDPGSQPRRDLTNISVEELAATEITSVARKAQKLSHTAAAIYVISREEIRRSGANSIPELLRMAPGLQVARVDAHRWVVTARGFAEQFSNKLLVLIDGRSVYTTQFSGVNWDDRDTPLEDIERIEVIRGPGATMWGANAVNGVINIITRPARDTQGLLLAAGTASQESGSATARYGFRAGENLHARVFGRYFARSPFRYDSGRSAEDDWSMSRGGFRLDWEPGRHRTLTVEADAYAGHANDLTGTAALTPPYNRTVSNRAGLAGGSLLGRWRERLSEGSELDLLFYYDESHRNALPLSRSTTHIANFDLQHRFRRAGHELTWGFGHRVTLDRLDGSFTYAMSPPRRTDELSNAFVQDEIDLAEGRVAITFGSKLEHNSYTGFEVEPSVRLIWTPGMHQALWGAASRAMRTPSRSDCCMRGNFATLEGAQGLTVLSIRGTTDFRSERSLSYEAGYRVQPARWLSLDAAGFYSVYGGVRGEEQGVPFLETAPAPPHLVIPLQFKNAINGSTHGAELASKWQPLARWKLSADYTWLRLDLRQRGAGQAEAERLENSSPKHQTHLHSYLDLPGGLEFDAGLYYVGALGEHNIPRFLRADARVGWRAWRALELSAGGENLLDRRHPEFWGRSGVTQETVEVGRNWYLKLSWRFE